MVEAKAQDSLADIIWENNPNYVNFDSKVYIEKLDSCFSFTDLYQLILPSDEIKPSKIVIETRRLKPINTTLSKIYSRSAVIDSIKYLQYPRGEISKRRVDFLINPPKYTCLENHAKNTNIQNEIQGLYKNIENYHIFISDKIVFILEETKNGYAIKIGEYSILDDRLVSIINEKYLWNKDSNELEKVLIEEEEFKVEACFLLKDCVQNHITVVSSMINWVKSEHDEFNEIIRRVNEYR